MLVFSLPQWFQAALQRGALPAKNRKRLLALASEAPPIAKLVREEWLMEKRKEDDLV
jgi:hypothetical protein